MASDVRGRADVAAPTLSENRIRFALFALALGGFAIGSTEFVAMGLLPNIAADLLPATWAVSHEQAVASAGALVSAYAAGVVVGAPIIAALGARLPRKALLLGLLIGFVVATAAASLLPTFGLVVLARFVAGLPHGAYFGIATLVASDLLGPGNRGRAAAWVLTGLTIANVIGVPVITFVGQQTSWRVSYLLVAAAFAATFFAVWIALPHLPADRSASMRGQLKAFTHGKFWLTMAIGAIGFGGFFCAYTYISPITTSVTGLPASVVPLVLVDFGIGMFLGNIGGGLFTDRGIRRSVLVCFVAVLVALAVLGLGSATPVGLFLGVLLVGVASSALSPAIQVRLIDVAHDGSATIAAATTHSALNIGNSLGAALGGAVIAAGLGYVAPIQVGLVLTGAGLVIAAISFGLERRGERSVHVARPDFAGPDA
jgi:MFS transporter, DHA1 family, inner membrane transport protein